MAQKYDPSVEKKWQKKWEDWGIYKFEPDSKKPLFSVDTPPPTVSGTIHMGHAFGYSQADFIVRFWRMRGYNIFYPFGFDDNGLPTALYVEKKRGIKERDFSRSEFIKICLEESKEAEKEFKSFWKTVGISVDWSLEYSTIDDWCRKTSQRSFIELYRKGRIYRKKAPTLWCPQCSTAIAQALLEDKEKKSRFVNIVFSLEDGKEITIATTRPELLPSCVAIFVHPDNKEHRHLVGKKAIVPLFGHTVPILADKRVDPKKGTGIVMCCTFGDLTDIEWWGAYNLALRIGIDKNGRMTELAGKYKGLTTQEAREEIIQDLKRENLIRSEKIILHTVNTHERCGKEIEFLVTNQWFVRYLDLKHKFIKAGRKVRWFPKYMRVRYENWINGLQWDWCISRQRYYGVPFPVWYCKKCGEVILAEDNELPVDPLHDKPKKPCTCGSKDFEPEKDIIDTWFTSSLTPQINGKWKEDERFFKKLYPMTLRPQGHDIIYLWAFNTIVKGLLHNNQIPWKDIMINGHALDPHGKKMSKSRGNIVDPKDVIENYSADALRFWAAGSKLGDDLPYKEKDIITGQRFINKLYNSGNFVYTHIKNHNPGKIKKKELNVIDAWMLSKLNRVIKEVTRLFEIYEYSKVKEVMDVFFWHEFCDFYLEMVKDRLYNPEKYKSEDDVSAKNTLYVTFLTILKLLAPILPHITEDLYQRRYKEEEGCVSIHVSAWPSVEKKFIDKKIEKLGEKAKDIITALRRYKTNKGLAMNAPIKELIIDCEKEIIPTIKGTMKIEKTERAKIKKQIGEKIETPKFKIKMSVVL
jgi:valyl-tRNA synthetase